MLVVKGPSTAFNPLIPQSIIDDALAADPEAAAAEWLAEFRSDLADFVVRDVVEALVVSDRHELPPATGTAYVAFTDPSGGSSDSMTLAIAHREKNGVGVLDAVREVRPPFSPEAIVGEFCDLLKSYRIAQVTGDHYAGEFPRELFRKQGVTYETSDKNKSAIYLDALALLNSGKVELLDNQRLINQLCQLERRTARGGRDSIDHPPGAHDDLANSSLGALLLAAAGTPAFHASNEQLARLRAGGLIPAHRPSLGFRQPARSGGGTIDLFAMQRFRR